jgi:hypothetical protein
MVSSGTAAGRQRTARLSRLIGIAWLDISDLPGWSTIRRTAAVGFLLEPVIGVGNQVWPCVGMMFGDRLDDRSCLGSRDRMCASGFPFGKGTSTPFGSLHAECLEAV